MNVLVACEESQEVCKAFREKGHNAFSCDIQECSGHRPEWHICGDVLPLLNGNCVFVTQNGERHEISGTWDLIIAHPPCTRLCVSGQRWLYHGTPEYRIKKWEEREIAIQFFYEFVYAECPRIVIENPVGIMSLLYRKPDQIIHPYQFGHPEQKATCLWLKGVQKLIPTNIIEKENRNTNIWKAIFDGKQYRWNDPIVKKLRSKTFPGIAKAMAEQWG